MVDRQIKGMLRSRSENIQYRIELRTMKISTMIISLMMSFLFATTIIKGARPSEAKYYQDRNDEELGDVSRVSIKVFRGADREENGKKYAPWGFWIKQPSGH